MSELQAQASKDAEQRRKNLQETLELQRQVAESQAARDGAQKEVGRLSVPLRAVRGSRGLWHKQGPRQGLWEELWGKQEVGDGKRQPISSLHPLSL